MVSPGVKQAYGSFGTICLLYAIGHWFGAMSLMLPALREPGSELKLSMDQESWIPSIIMLMQIPTSLSAGILSDLYGRKVIMCVAMLPMIISSILMYCASSFLHLFAAAMIMGLCGAGVAVGQSFIAEVVSPRWRGAVLAINPTAGTLGLCVTLALGKLVHWRTIIIYNVLPAILGLITLLTSPDSFTWFASQGKLDACRSAFFWFKGSGNHKEMILLMEKHKQMEATKLSRSSKNKLTNTLKIFFEKNFIKSSLICFATLLCFEASGKTVYNTFALDFMVNITGDTEHANYFALGANLCDMVAAGLSILVLRVWKRRTVLFTSGFLALVFLLTFCILSYLRSCKTLDNGYTWLVLASFIGYFFFINIGVLPVFTTIPREIYPVFHRGLGIVVTGMTNGVLLFILMKIFPIWVQAYGIHGTFLINGIVMLVALAYLYFFLPETGNKTLYDIECEITEERLPESSTPDIMPRILYNPCDSNTRESSASLSLALQTNNFN